ncbi:Retrovirus-related Pol polyprotein LINE-1 [Gossypium australe]|uniref:Retrovirus-related Pol polyprotein LINE-1 n=1 Tax=Gossypium australe TaxID=47621 RepID=A0A5B6X682_9ROSI|nr:Retrovirus-related Pol polyprotein LINE-1 [Gossypium australe]
MAYTLYSIRVNRSMLWVKRIFSGENIDPDLNNSLIVLLPKVQHPECLSQFRPISLCLVLYKLVMKVIANRFKVVFRKISRPKQAGSVARRKSKDNIIIVQEVIHSMKNKQKNKRWMAIKINLEKAYDRVHRDFIDASLQAEENQARVIKEGLDTFCAFLGYNVNLKKSNMFFSKGVGEDIQRCISGIFGFQVVQNLGSYLGVPHFHEKVTNNTLRFVMDKVCSKLCSWYARQLSLAGRITLVQSVLLSIPSYFMQSMMIPKGLCDEIEVMVRQFIWGTTSGNKKNSFGQLGYYMPT